MAESLEIVREADKSMTMDDAIKAGVSAYGIVTSFAIETDDDKKRLFKAQNAAASLADMDGTYINLVDVAFTESNLVDDEGESKDNPGVILIDADGECYFSGSLGVYQSVKSIINSFGMPATWSAPIKVVTKTRTLRNGRQYRYLDM
jgi:hypothetical protein